MDAGSAGAMAGTRFFPPHLCTSSYTVFVQFSSVVAAAARARERALAAHRKDEEEDEEDEGSTLVSEETNPMLDGELRGNNPNPTVAADRLGVVS